MLSEEPLPKEEKNFEMEETEDAYRAYFFPEATDHKLIEKEKYRLMIGRKGNQEFPKWLDYYKKYYTSEEAEGYARKINQCSFCKWVLDFQRELSEHTGKPVIAMFDKED